MSEDYRKRPIPLPRKPQGTALNAVRPAAAVTTSQVLLGTAGELLIQHDGREYRLRQTRNGKLILTA